MSGEWGEPATVEADTQASPTCGPEPPRGDAEAWAEGVARRGVVSPDGAHGGRYRPIRVLGVGASATTTLCQDRQTGAQVALKALRVDALEDWKRFELFERESRVLASLAHPGIPAVLDSFEEHDRDGRPTFYLVQEYIAGLDLQQGLDGGHRPNADGLVELARHLCEILDYLHGTAPPIIHRDIKPANIVVRPDGRPALVDFGAVIDGWRAPGEAGSTIVGTAGYMPPEQYVGQASPRSDMYALGATLLHLATGRPPSELYRDSGRLEIPEDVAIDPGLRRLLTHVLEPAARDRPASAKEAMALLDGPAPTATPTSAKGWRPPSADAPFLVRLSEAPRVVDQALADDNRVRLAEGSSRAWWGLGGVTAAATGVFAWVAAAGQGGLAAAAPAMAAFVGISGFLVAMGGVAAAKDRRTLQLLREGRFAVGHVKLVTDRVLRYTYVDAAGVEHEGFSRAAPIGTEPLAPGTRVAVVYDPDRPQRSTLVRPPGGAAEPTGGR